MLHQHRIEKVLVVDDSFHLKGMVTAKDFQKATDFPLASKDGNGALLVGAAVGVGDGSEERVEALKAAGVDVIVVDTAHAHTEGVINQVKSIKKMHSDLEVIAGNIATGEASPVAILPAITSRSECIFLIDLT